MYSGTTLTRLSGRVMGTHQKIDRVARKQLTRLLFDSQVFPPIRRILHYEGVNGPDGIKRKSPSQDEPWHFIDPFDDKDEQLLHLITDHYDKLVHELRAQNTERAAFEAAWLAHALVDGLTPAHHYPYEEEFAKLNHGKAPHENTSVKQKLVMPGVTLKEQAHNNWKAWGPKGLRTAHGFFEIGIATLMAPLGFGEVNVREEDIAELRKTGLSQWFRQVAREIAVLDMYGSYINKGWTPKLAYDIRHKLGPSLVHTVATAWGAAMLDARKKV